MGESGGGIWDTHLFDGGVVLLKSGTPTFFITSLIEKKSPWIPMMASVAGSSSGYLIGKGEAPLNRWLNPEKNNMKWRYSPNAPIVYPYPKNNFPSVAAGSLSATASEVASKNTEYLIKSIKEVK